MESVEGRTEAQIIIKRLVKEIVVSVMKSWWIYIFTMEI